MALKVITLNIWNYNRFDERKHRIIDFLREEDADIVALQEIRDDARYNVEGNNQAEQLQQALQYPHMVFVDTMDLNEIDHTPLLPKRTEGFALLSKYPILRSRKHPLVQHPEDKFTRRLLHCTVRAEREVDVIVVHFSPHVLYSELHLIDTMRYVREKKLQPIILGDFNIYRPDIIEQHTPELHGSYGHTPYISYPSRGWAIDHILIPRHARFLSVSASGDDISDHRAIIAHVEL